MTRAIAAAEEDFTEKIDFLLRSSNNRELTITNTVKKAGLFQNSVINDYEWWRFNLIWHC